MDQVRLGVVGLGNIGRFHASCLLEGKVRGAELTCVCSRRDQPLPATAPVQVFPELPSLLQSGLVDAVVIATPHPQHAAEGIAAFEAGLHVLMEKPIAAHKAEAERLIAAQARHPQTVFAAMYQFRTEPRYRKIRELIQREALGRLVRVNWINTDWFRTDAYYASSAWRATWQGEGGGVLINQCLHNLDLLQWLCGMPARVQGFARLGHYHPIEVEDDVTAWLEWPEGATGIFIGSTGEPHVAVMQNFVDAIREGIPLLAPGAEGLRSVELANAILFSSLLHRPVDLPLDGAAWEARLHDLIAQSALAPAGQLDTSRK